MIPDSAEGPIENPQNLSPVAERQRSDWDVRNAPKNYISLVLFQGGVVVFGFAAIWLLTRTFGSQGYGGIVSVIAASQIAQVCVNWTSFSLVRFGVDEFVETQKIAKIFWTRFSILLVNIVLAFLIAKIWYPYIATSFNFLPETYWLVFGHFVAVALWIHVQISLQGAKIPRAQGFLLMFERVIILGSILFFLAIGKLYISSAILSYIGASLVVTVMGLFRLRHYIWARFPIDFEFYKKVIVFSLPLLPFTLVGYFSGNQVDYVFVSRFLSTRDLGVYSVAAQMSGILLQVPTVANSLLIPLFVTLQKESQNHKIERFFKDVLPTLSLVWSILCCIGGFVGYFAIPVMFGEQFEGAATPWLVLTAAIAASFPVLVGYSALSHAISATYIAMFASIFAAGINILLNFILIPKYGLIGCAWSTVLAQSVSVVCFGYLLGRKGNIAIFRTVLSILPALAGAVVFTITLKPLWSLFAGGIVILIVAYWERTSIPKAFSFIRGSFEK